MNIWELVILDDNWKEAVMLYQAFLAEKKFENNMILLILKAGWNRHYIAKNKREIKNPKQNARVPLFLNSAFTFV